MPYTLSELRDLCDEAEALEAWLLARADIMFSIRDDFMVLVYAHAAAHTTRRLRKLYASRPIPVDVRPTEERSW